MHRSHTCGELRISNVGSQVTLSGWVQKARDMGHMNFIDLRDRYGITQINVPGGSGEISETAKKLGREFVIKVTGTVRERESKNPNIDTGEIEIEPISIEILNASKTPPFTIEDETDGGEELRMQYRYLDLRRNPLHKNLALRHQVGLEIRKYLSDSGFLEIETPYLIKTTPEGARDFVVPSRMHPGQFYALPQSPQTLKQLLMVSGYDRYFQIVKCFRDEDLRSDRQPEFSQIDCEMAFVEQEDVIATFEGLLRHLLKELKGLDVGPFQRMTYADAMRDYGSDKPDIRFGMKFCELNDLAQGKGFVVFDSTELVVGINAEGCGEYSRKQLDALVDWVKRPQIGMKGLVYVKCNADGTFKSSVDKFFDHDALKTWADKAGAKPGDLLLVLAGDAEKTRKALGELRIEMGNRLGLRKPDEYLPLWIVEFPLLEQDEESGHWHAMHHPFTSPMKEDAHLLESDPGKVRANAYDLTLNGVELGGGSIRIHERPMQERMFKALGFTEEEAQKQFGFLMGAFEYGAPPHGGIAFGFDRLTALLGGEEAIRDFIAFPKNNAGRDMMMDAPSTASKEQLEELSLEVKIKEEAGS